MWILTSLLGSLRAPLAGLVGAVFSLLLLVAVVVLNVKMVGAEHRAGKAEAAARTLETKLGFFQNSYAVCTANNAKYVAAIDEQNNRIKVYEAAAAKQAGDAQRKVDEAVRQASAREKNLRERLAALPKTTDRCEAANAAIDLAIR